MKIMFLFIALMIAILLAALRFFGGPQGPELEKVAYLKQPQISRIPDRKVIAVELTGDPDSISRLGSRILYQTYSKLPGVPKGDKMPALLARWPKPFETPRDQWLGRFALPLPDGVISLPSVPDRSGIKPTLTGWSGGDMAEILHVGPYSGESPTVERLRQYIASSGYEIAGELEEEYLRGPGILFAGDPSTYLTMIRYPVRKQGP